MDRATTCCISSHGFHPRRGSWSWREKLVCRIDQRGAGDRLGRLVCGNIDARDRRLGDLGIHRGTGAAFDSDVVVARAAQVSPSEGTP